MPNCQAFLAIVLADASFDDVEGEPDDVGDVWVEDGMFNVSYQCDDTVVCSDSHQVERVQRTKRPDADPMIVKGMSVSPRGQVRKVRMKGIYHVFVF